MWHIYATLRVKILEESTLLSAELLREDHSRMQVQITARATVTFSPRHATTCNYFHALVRRHTGHLNT